MRPGVQGQIMLVSSGYLRLLATPNRYALKHQKAHSLTAAIEQFCCSIKHVQIYNPSKKNSFFDLQKISNPIYQKIVPNRTTTVAENIKQYICQVPVDFPVTNLSSKPN